MAEELILICFIILAKIALGQQILLSDDRRGFPKVLRVIDHIEKHCPHAKKPVQTSTPKLVQKMYQKQMILSAEDMASILYYAEQIKIYCIGATDLKIVERSFTRVDLIDKIQHDPEFYIVF